LQRIIAAAKPRAVFDSKGGPIQRFTNAGLEGKPRMEIKPPVAIGIIAVVLILLVGGYFMYEKKQKESMNNTPLTQQQYMPPHPPGQ
jgi:hypothetical protein